MQNLLKQVGYYCQKGRIRSQYFDQQQAIT